MPVHGGVLEGLSLVDDEVRFAADLYRGTAGYYDRYRLPYPEAMIEDLARTARVSGRGRLLDLACGTGQLTFPLRQRFADVWAVDQEPDMVEVVRVKAAAAGARNVRPIVASAETLHAAPGHFELAVIGNAFHRLDRDVAARRIHGWLQPGGHLALCWSSTPWIGEAGWQLAGPHQFAIEHRWTPPELAGFIRSTSFLPAAVLGDQADSFDADLAARLGPHSDASTFTETVSFFYELAQKPR